VVDDAIHTGYLVDDARGDALEKVIGKARPIRRHEVFGRHRAKRDECPVRPVVALHTDAAHRRENRERLCDGAVEIRSTQLFEEDRVRAPERLETFAIDRSEHPHRETRAGERMPPENVLRDAELGADAADLILEEAPERL